MDNGSRLRIATRIHYLLTRYLGDGIDVGAMLEREDYAREVLFVCDASDAPELHVLARQFRDTQMIDASAAVRPSGAAVPRAAAPQDTDWARDGSGFGISRSLPLARSAAARRGARWYDPSSWFGGLQT